MEEKSLDVLKKVINREPVFWKNPLAAPESAQELSKTAAGRRINVSGIYDAQKRLERFKPFLESEFPETGDGTIESPLKAAFSYAKSVLDIDNRYYIKCDNSLQVAGSIKARGGIYEILKHAEDLALEKGLIAKTDNYSLFSTQRIRDFFSDYKVAVGSTGNLGLSIGIISAKMGFNVTIHMSHDAKQWKKDKLRSIGAHVIEYSDSYSKAVEEGRRSCAGDPYSYFVDDENSADLFLGYSTAALRLKKQLSDMEIEINSSNKLNVYLPCGVGGAPGGICFGLKHVFGDNVGCYFAEPVQAPSVLLGFLTGRKINLREYNIEMSTDADGLAVDSPSELVLDACRKLVDGIYTVDDRTMYRDLYLLKKHEDEKIEVSAAAGLRGPLITGNSSNTSVHIAWLTGGSFVPDDEYSVMLEKGRSFMASDA